MIELIERKPLKMNFKNDLLNSTICTIASYLVLWKKRDVLSGFWNGPKSICISFDCDYENDMKACKQVTEVLQSYDIPASFAIPGHMVRAFPDVTKNLIKDGYEILNHTFSHPDNFRNLTESRLRSEIDNYQNFMKVNYNYIPRGFRTPHGLRNITPMLFNILREFGMYDSSLIGRGISDLNNLLEIPLTPCPIHPLMAFDTFHHFRFPLFTSSEEKVLQLWKRMLDENTLINIFMDPMDMSTKSRLLLLEQMIIAGKEKGFNLIKMGTLAKDYGV